MSAYGGLPVNNSITVQPNDHISDFVEVPFSSITSGAIQFGVPAISFWVWRSIARRLRDTPKSESFTFPFFVVRILAAFKSQCTTSL